MQLNAKFFLMVAILICQAATQAKFYWPTKRHQSRYIAPKKIKQIENCLKKYQQEYAPELDLLKQSYVSKQKKTKQVTKIVLKKSNKVAEKKAIILGICL